MWNNRYLPLLPLAALGVALLQATQARAAGQEGMVAVRDPQSGQLRAPTPAEMKALAPAPAATLRATVPLSRLVVQNPDGSRKLHLGERGMVYSLATRGADGQLDQHCVEGEAAAARALAAPVPRQPELRHDDH